MTPHQGPTAAFTDDAPAPVGSPTSFDASASSASGGTVATYHWEFGDGNTQTTSSAMTTHTYDSVGDYTATLTVTDDVGCSADQTFTGQTVSCNGGPKAAISHQLQAGTVPQLFTSAADTNLGGTMYDLATLIGGDSPTGTITFKAYGPNDATCSSPPAFTSSPVTVSGNSGYQSPTFAPTSPGSYRWIADYSGDANNNSVAGGCNDSGETSTVGKAFPTIDTNATSATLGASIHDTATLAGGSSATGTITFKAYGLTDTNCSKPAAFTTSKSVNGDGSYVSSGFAPTKAGSYRWRAIYSGDANNNAVSGACNDPHETSSVNKVNPTLTTTASPSVALGRTVRDTAKLTGHSPTGKLTFRLYGPGDSSCSKAPVFTTNNPVTASGAYPSATFKPAKIGTYRWRATYSGDANNKSAAGACNAPKESVSVTKN